MTDLYGALGLEKNATPDQIRKAYRKQAKKAHPDAGGSTEKFSQIALAHDVLTDPGRKAEYDATGSIGEKPQDKGLSAVMQALDYVLNECERRHIDPSTVDVIADAIKSLKIKIEQMDEQDRAARKLIEKAKKTAKRFKAKKGKQNRIVPLLEGRIRQAEGDMLNITRDRPSLLAAIEILSDHTFDWTAPELGIPPTTWNMASYLRKAGV